MRQLVTLFGLVLSLVGSWSYAQDNAQAGSGDQRKPVPERLAVMTFDDATRSHLKVAAPLLKERGFGATFFVTAAWMGDRENFLDWEEIVALHRMGFEVGNHSMHHVALHDPDPIEVLDREILELEAGLTRVGVPKPVSFSWPGNHFGPRSVQRLQELGYRFGRRGPMPDVPAGIAVVGMGPLYDPTRHHSLLIPTAALAIPDWTLDDFKKVTARAIRGQVLVFQFHGTPDGAHPFCSTPPDRFAEFLDHLKAEGFTVIALRDLACYFDLRDQPQDPLMAKVHFFGQATGKQGE